MTIATRLSETVWPWIEKAIGDYPQDLGEIVWDFSLTTLPDPTRDGQFVSAATVYLQKATGRGDEHVVNTVLLSPGFTEEAVRDLVHTALDGFRAKLFEVTVTEEVRDRVVQPDLTNLGKPTP